jgi:ATP-dependent DNA helicase DinG
VLVINSHLSHISSKAILSSQGPLAEIIPGYCEREPQLQLTAAIEQALAGQEVLIAEAGTGTGKTFAYLVPALLSGKKIIISTGTKNLQDQLFHYDLPTLMKALKVSARVALLKGRANYLCLQRLNNAYEDGRFTSQRVASDVQKLKSWLSSTRTGDTSEFSELPENAEVWPLVTSNADNCLGQDCPHWSDCYLVKARRKAQEADIVVVNHHLFFADMALREEGFAELLPLAEALILDEAHQLAEIASHFFGESISSRQLLELAHDVQLTALTHAKEIKEFDTLCQQLQVAVQKMRLAFGEPPRRKPWHEIANKTILQKAITELKVPLQQLLELLNNQAERSEELANSAKRCQELSAKFARMTAAAETKQIHWYEVFNKAFSIHFTPMDIAEPFQQMMQAATKAWVFTSATLAVSGNFEHFAAQLGIKQAKTLLLASPFNYKQQAVLYVPATMVDANHPNYTEEVVKAAVPVLQASRGRAFMLFTSHAALQAAARLLQQQLEFPLLVQGQAPKLQLLTQFKQLNNAILLGTSSFWEGVDVRGEALTCVIIDKLPFAAPDDPILQARATALQAAGQNAFIEYQLPRAVLMLKQGAGRLIRDQADYGVLMICDLRLIQRSYGQTFLASLPPMARTRHLNKVVQFLTHLSPKQDALCPES